MTERGHRERAARRDAGPGSGKAANGVANADAATERIGRDQRPKDRRGPPSRTEHPPEEGEAKEALLSSAEEERRKKKRSKKKKS